MKSVEYFIALQKKIETYFLIAINEYMSVLLYCFSFLSWLHNTKSFFKVLNRTLHLGPSGYEDGLHCLSWCTIRIKKIAVSWFKIFYLLGIRKTSARFYLAIEYERTETTESYLDRFYLVEMKNWMTNFNHIFEIFNFWFYDISIYIS